VTKKEIKLEELKVCAATKQGS